MPRKTLGKCVEVSFKEMIILPPGPGKCLECAEAHDPRLPHNRDSLYYNMKFRQQHDRAPTWADAIAHCPDDVKAVAIEELAKHGINAAATETVRA